MHQVACTEVSRGSNYFLIVVHAALVSGSIARTAAEAWLKMLKRLTCKSVPNKRTHAMATDSKSSSDESEHWLKKQRVNSDDAPPGREVRGSAPERAHCADITTAHGLKRPGDEDSLDCERPNKQRKSRCDPCVLLSLATHNPFVFEAGLPKLSRRRNWTHRSTR